MTDQKSSVKGKNPTRKQIAKAVIDDFCKRETPDYYVGLFAPERMSDNMENTKHEIGDSNIDTVDSDTNIVSGTDVDTDSDTDADTDADTHTDADRAPSVPPRGVSHDNLLEHAKACLPDYLRYIGLDPSKNMKCLHHQPDNHPSMCLLPDHTHVFCHACGWQADLVNVIAEVEHLRPNSKDAISRAIEFAGLTPSASANAKKHANDNRIKDFIETCHQSLLSNCDSSRIALDYLHSRGFVEPDTLLSLIKSFKIGYNTPSRCLIIPHGHLPNGLTYYTARDIRPDCPKAERFKHSAQSKKLLFNPDALTQHVCFITEGAIDALSIIACGFHAVATGGAQGKSALFDELQRLDTLPAFIVAFDNDDNHAGEIAANALANKLVDTFHTTVMISLPPEHFHDINDAFTADRYALTEYLLQQVKKAEAAKLQTSFGDSASRIPDNVISPNETSDLAVAKRIINAFPDRIRYNFDSARFMLYQNQKPLWLTLNKDSELRSIVDEFRSSISSSARRIDKRISSSLSKSKCVDAVIKMFYGFNHIRITNDDLNSHNMLLPCKNGVVDLETGKLFPHDGNQLWTKIANFHFDVKAPRSIFRDFIAQIIPDEQTRQTLQTFLGYCLTASVEEEKALFVHGSGGNGKGTLFGAVERCLGDFAVNLKIDSLLAGNRSNDANAASPEFNKLQFARLAVAEEIPAKQKLDTAQFKLLTGGDQLPIRLLHHESSVIKNPSHKLILSGNHLPQLSDPNDEGLKRRLMVVRFPASFTDQNRDPKLKQKLAQPNVLSDIANWLVDGCLMWQQDGLHASEQMQLERDTYLSDNDLVADFIAEHCILGADKSVSRQALIEHVKKFGDPDLRQMRDKELVDAFTKLDGIEYKKTMVGRVFYGIGLPPSDGCSTK